MKKGSSVTLVRNDKLKLYDKVNFLILLAFCYLSVNYKGFLFGMIFLLSQNVLKFMLNAFLLSMSIYGALRLYFMPVWNFVFQDTTELGRKLEWYEQRLEHMSPETKKMFYLRLAVVFSISLILFIFKNTTDIGYIANIGFQKLNAYTPESKIILRMVDGKTLFLLSKFFEFTLVLYLCFFIEGRARVFARILKYRKKYELEHAHVKLLPESPYKEDSENLDVTLYSAFMDEKQEYVFEETGWEQWLTMPEESIARNIAGIGPTGSGKTQGLVLPFMEQVIRWQAKNKEKKASVAIYDPKSELKDYAIDIANACGRQDDIEVISFENDNYINLIKVEDEILWKGETSWNISSWIVCAWQNYQGQSSPEPYWMSQSYNLVRKLLVYLFIDHGSNTSLYLLGKKLIESIQGCYRIRQNKEVLNEFGENLLIRHIAFLPKNERFEKIYQYDLDISGEIILTPAEKTKKDEIKELKLKEFKDDKIEAIKKENPDILALIEEHRKDPISRKFYQDFKKELALDKTDAGKKAINLIERELNKLVSQKFNNEYLNYLSKVVKIESEAEKIRKRLDNEIPEEYYLDATMGIIEITNYFLNSWGRASEEGRNSIASNIQTFLLQFSTANAKRVFSPDEETISFDEIIEQGKILIPSFSGAKNGRGISSAIITMIKTRWQQSVLSPKNETIKNRFKVQLMDEAQQIITFGGGKFDDDFTFMETSRSSNCSTMLLSQTIAALKAKAPRFVDFDKAYGVLVNQVYLPTTDLATINHIKAIVGKKEFEKKSRSVSENISNPELDVLNEKFASQTDSMSLSYTISSVKEDIVDARNIQNAGSFTAIALIEVGNERVNSKVSLKPYYLKIKRLKWKRLKELNFKG